MNKARIGKTLNTQDELSPFDTQQNLFFALDK
jgi:hypothetical protein